MEKKRGRYVKHAYWLSREMEERLRGELRLRGVKVKRAKGLVCTPLDPINRISSVAPEVWGETCRRQGSWYRSSDKNGSFLVISAFELEGWEAYKASTITASDFSPPRPAAREEKEALVREVAAGKVPSEWWEVGETEKRIYLRWAKRFGSDAQSYEFLLLSHTANHCNFLSPRFYATDGEGAIPYSIDRTAHLCSCCLELFQVVGSEHRRKLVAPCPGAAIFARLKRDRYLLVEKPGTSKDALSSGMDRL